MQLLEHRAVAIVYGFNPVYHSIHEPSLLLGQLRHVVNFIVQHTYDLISRKTILTHRQFFVAHHHFVHIFSYFFNAH